MNLIDHPVLKSLAKVFEGDGGLAREISDRSRDFQDAMKATRRQVQAFSGSLEQPLTGGIEVTEPIESASAE